MHEACLRESFPGTVTNSHERDHDGLAVRRWPGAAFPRSRLSLAVAGRGKGGPKAHPGGRRSALAAGKTAGIMCGRRRAARRCSADLCAVARGVRGGFPMLAGLAARWHEQHEARPVELRHARCSCEGGASGGQWRRTLWDCDLAVPTWPTWADAVNESYGFSMGSGPSRPARDLPTMA